MACLFLEYVESELLVNYTGVKPLFWYRYVDDVLCLIPEDFDLNNYLDFINNLCPSLKFTFELESDGKIPFLDVLIHRFENDLKFSVYRKSTHSESYLHFYSMTALNVKIGVAQGLFLRALRICDPSYLDDEINHIKCSLTKLAYPDDVLNKALSKAKTSYFRSTKNSDKNRSNFDFNNSVIVPFVPSLENMNRNLTLIDKKVIFKYNSKISNLLTKNAISGKSNDIPGVYRIDCKDCDQMYFGETGRTLNKRIKEHRKDVRSIDLEVV